MHGMLDFFSAGKRLAVEASYYEPHHIQSNYPVGYGLQTNIEFANYGWHRVDFKPNLQEEKRAKELTQERIPVNRFGNIVLTIEALQSVFGDKDVKDIKNAFLYAEAAYKYQFRPEFPHARIIRNPASAIFTDLDQVYAKLLKHALGLEYQISKAYQEELDAHGDQAKEDAAYKKQKNYKSQLAHFRIILDQLDPSIGNLTLDKKTVARLKQVKEIIGEDCYLTRTLAFLGKTGLIAIILFDTIRSGYLGHGHLENYFGPELANNIMNAYNNLSDFKLDKTWVIPSLKERKNDDLITFLSRYYFPKDESEKAAKQEWLAARRHKQVDSADRDIDALFAATEIASQIDFPVQFALAPPKDFERVLQKSFEDKTGIGILRVIDLRRISLLVDTTEQAQRALELLLASKNFAMLRVVDGYKADNMMGYKAYHALITPITGEAYACNPIEFKLIVNAYNDIQTFYGGHYTYEILRDYNSIYSTENKTADIFKKVIDRVSRQEFAIADYNSGFSKALPEKDLFVAYTPANERVKKLNYADPLAVIYEVIAESLIAIKYNQLHIDDQAVQTFLNLCHTVCCDLTGHEQSPFLSQDFQSIENALRTTREIGKQVIHRANNNPEIDAIIINTQQQLAQLFIGNDTPVPPGFRLLTANLGHTLVPAQ